MSEANVGSSIEIRLVVFADLRRLLPPGHDGRYALTLPTGSTIADAAAAAGLHLDPEEQIRAGINGEPAPLDATVPDGAEVVLFGPLEGG